MNQYQIAKKFLNEIIVHQKKPILLLFILVVFEGVVASLSVIAVIPLTDYIINQDLLNPSSVTSYLIQVYSYLGVNIHFWAFGLFFITMNISSALLKLFIRYKILKIKYSVFADIYKNSLDTFLNSELQFFTSSDAGKILNTFAKELSNIATTIASVATIFAQAFQLIIYIAIPFYLSPQMTITALLIALVVMSPFALTMKYSYKLGRLTTRTGNQVLGILNEIFQLIKIILAFGQKDITRKNFSEKVDENINVTIKSQILKKVISVMSMPMGVLSAVIALGITLDSGDEKISELAAVLWSLLSALPILSGLVGLSVDINNLLPSYYQLTKLRESAHRFKEISGEKRFQILNTIVLKDASFYYENHKVLNSINMKINQGETIAIIGPSGSGKSTLIDILCSLHKLDEGSMLLNDIDINSYDLSSYRKKIAYVPQDPVLFSDSIKENIIWSKPDCSDEEIENALEMSNAKNFINELQYGLETLVGERGVRLSGGQRQRIALARALVRQPELLLLDEATSSLDTLSEREIQDSLNTLHGKLTIIIVAHRISTIREADRIYFLKNGEIAEVGSYSELSKNSSDFQAMLKSAKLM